MNYHKIIRQMAGKSAASTANPRRSRRGRFTVPTADLSAPVDDDNNLLNPINAPLLEIDGITFGYDRHPLLYDIHMRVDAGEMIGLLGPNGSGKTTLLRLVSGILRPQQGNILLEGRDLQAWGRRGIARRIAVVPQELHVPFAFTVEEMVSLGRTPFTGLLGTRSKQDINITQDAMQSTEISALAGRIFNELSGGERQRVAIAMALAQQPSLLLLDEPTSHLDIKYQIEILDLVRQLNRHLGVTVIAAMHDLNLVARYFPRLLLFQRGIVADDSPAKVLEPQLLHRVYGVNVQVGILRGATHLSVLPPGEETREIEQEKPVQPRIHLMAGGGSGELLMRALADAHIPFTTGALNIGDSDHTLALLLATEVITEQPYAPISTHALEQVRASLMRASLLIISPMPVGPGNLALLQEAAEAAKRGVAVLLFAPAATASQDDTDEPQTLSERLLQRTGIATRDYTNGEGMKLVREMLQAGARVVDSLGEAIEIARQYSYI